MTRPARHCNSAAVIGHNAVHPGESQSAMSSFFSREERLKDPRHHIGLDSTSAVADLHTHVTTRSELGIPILGRLRELYILRLQRHATVLGKSLHGILQHLHE